MLTFNPWVLRRNAIITNLKPFYLPLNDMQYTCISLLSFSNSITVHQPGQGNENIKQNGNYLFQNIAFSCIECQIMTLFMIYYSPHYCLYDVSSVSLNNTPTKRKISCKWHFPADDTVSSTVLVLSKLKK